MLNYVKALLVAPLIGPIIGLVIVIIYSKQFPQIGYIITYIGLGIIMSYTIVIIAGIPVVYFLLKYNAYSLGNLLICSIIISILLSVFFLKENVDAGIKHWLFVITVLSGSSTSVSLMFWYLSKNLRDNM